MDGARTANAQRQSEIARERLTRTFKVTAIKNGFLLNEGQSSESEFVSTLDEVMDRMRGFYDNLRQVTTPPAVGVRFRAPGK